MKDEAMETRFIDEIPHTYMPFSNSEPGFPTESANTSKGDAACKEKIRTAMMDTLEKAGAVTNARSVRLFWLINFAENVSTLWFLRPEWMSTLAAVQGEKTAISLLKKIDPLFHKVIPKSLVARGLRFH
jgi:hypothetical protein